MSSSVPNLHVAWSRLFVRALAAASVRHVVVSPGSRSTPLALAFAAEESLLKHVVIDERSAGFFALGIARRTLAPVVLVCTSGTAAAHYFPALLEAEASHLPLVVVTADRPWDAYDCGASQTMDQVKLFGGHVRHYAELGLPDADLAALSAVGRIALRAVMASLSPLAGPVHVNARFRKPLEPEGIVDESAWPERLRELLAAAAPRIYPAVAGPDEAAVQALITAVEGARDGIVAVGPGAPSQTASRAAVARFAERAGFAVFAEATSQHRFGSTPPTSVASFDALLRVPHFRDRAPDLLVEIGSPLVSAAYLAYRERHRAVPAFRLAAEGFADPVGRASHLLGPVSALLEAASAGLVARTPSPLLSALREADRTARALVVGELDGETFTEGQVAAEAVAALPEDAVLLVGNSSPVRDLDLYNDHMSRSLQVLHQRGVAGIDGLVAGAAGAAAAGRTPLLVLLGDVSFAHDLGSLAVARAARTPLVALVVDNGGGRIFGELPLARRTELQEPFDRYFTTPPDLDFVSIARAFGAVAERVQTRGELRAALAAAMQRPGLTVVVARVDVAGRPPHESPRRDLAARILQALEGP